MSLPFASVIIPNFNGRQYLATCLDALLLQSYPTDCYEIILVDNGSSDGSIQFVQDHYPSVRLVVNRVNLGFTGGCNTAIQYARGDYIVLLNNDTAVTSNWLENMISVAEANQDAGIVTGHLQLFHDQFEISIETEASLLARDDQSCGVIISGVDSGVSRGHVQYLQGFSQWEILPSGERFRRIDKKALLGVPIPTGDGPWQLCLRLSASCATNLPVHIMSGLSSLAQIQVSSVVPADYILTLPATTRNAALPLVQNAGTVALRGGYGRDRGVYVRRSEVFYETDREQYNQVEDVFAGCGASLLMRRTMLDDIGLLDDDFFAYYEDMDLSWRAHLRNWQVLYSPQAVVRHVHCGTSEEWSPRFMYLTERNRLAMVFKNGSTSQIRDAWLGFAASVVRNAVNMMSMISHRRKGWRPYFRQVLIQIHICVTLFSWAPKLIHRRHHIQSSRKVKQVSISRWFVEDKNSE
jgi:GT2 family glycosyltransferase